jgi:hypothetical protein
VIGLVVGLPTLILVLRRIPVVSTRFGDAVVVVAPMAAVEGSMRTVD